MHCSEIQFFFIKKASLKQKSLTSNKHAKFHATHLPSTVKSQICILCMCPHPIQPYPICFHTFVFENGTPNKHIPTHTHPLIDTCPSHIITHYSIQNKQNLKTPENKRKKKKTHEPTSTNGASKTKICHYNLILESQLDAPHPHQWASVTSTGVFFSLYVSYTA